MRASPACALLVVVAGCTPVVPHLPPPELGTLGALERIEPVLAERCRDRDDGEPMGPFESTDSLGGIPPGHMYQDVQCRDSRTSLRVTVACYLDGTPPRRWISDVTVEGRGAATPRDALRVAMDYAAPLLTPDERAGLAAMVERTPTPGHVYRLGSVVVAVFENGPETAVIMPNVRWLYWPVNSGEWTAR